MDEDDTKLIGKMIMVFVVLTIIVFVASIFGLVAYWIVLIVLFLIGLGIYLKKESQFFRS